MRNIAHIVGLMAIAYLLSGLHLNDIIGKMAVGVVAGTLIGVLFEIFQENWNRQFDTASTFSWADVSVCASGAIAGAILHDLLHSLAATIIAWVIVVAGIGYIVRQIVNRKPL